VNHQHIVHKLNRRAEVERENARLDDIERRATPLFYVVMLAAVGMVGGSLIDEYAESKHAGSVKTASTFAQCLNGKSVARRLNSALRCQTIRARRWPEMIAFLRALYRHYFRQGYRFSKALEIARGKL
jgi:hypothetical protein